MSTAGPNSPSTAADDASVGSITWTNVNNSKALDGVFASAANVNAANGSHWLKETGFGFSIPAGSTINGIKVTVAAKLTAESGTGSFFSGVKLVIGGTISGNETTGFGFSSTVVSTNDYGSSSALWGLTPSVSDVNGATFGCVFRYGPLTSTLQETCNVDQITITVTYTAAVTGYKNLPLLGVGLINTLIHGLTLGLCSWRWRPFTRTQTRTAGVMA